MRSSNRDEASKAIGWLLVGLTVLPLVAARAEAPEPADATDHLAQLLARHDARELIYMSPAEHADCPASTEENEQ